MKRQELFERIEKQHKILINERNAVLSRTDSLLANAQILNGISAKDLSKICKWWNKFSDNLPPLFTYAGLVNSINKDLRSEDIEKQLQAIVRMCEFHESRSRLSKELRDFNKLGAADYLLGPLPKKPKTFLEY